MAPPSLTASWRATKAFRFFRGRGAGLMKEMTTTRRGVMSKKSFGRVKASRKALIAAVALTTMAGLSIVVSNGSALASTSKKIGGSVSIWAEWTSTEQQDFKA